MTRPLRVPASALREGSLELSEETSRYVIKVRRLARGDTLCLFDPESGLEALEARILDDRLPRITVSLSELRLAPNQEMPVTLHLGVGKGDKPEQAVRDVTAYGAHALCLLSTERSVARSTGATRHQRLARVAIQVARQCERGRLPRIDGPVPFSELPSFSDPGAARFVCDFSPEARPLFTELSELAATRPVEILVGPEGGLSELELGIARELGFRPISLGPYVLRTEAACSFVLSAARASWLGARQGWR